MSLSSSMTLQLCFVLFLILEKKRSLADDMSLEDTFLKLGKWSG